MIDCVRQGFLYSCLISMLMSFSIQQPLIAQEAPQVAAQETSEAVSELDQWRGCSLGIRIERRNGKVYVEEIHEHVADSTPFLVGDRIVSVAGTEVTADTIEDMSAYLRKTAPDTEIQVVVEREDQQMELSLTTVRRELVDIPQIVRQLQTNRIIKQHLEETDRSGFLETVSERMVNAVMTSRSPREAAEGINAIIDEIDVSHTAILPPQSFDQMNGGQPGDPGLTLQRHQMNGQNRYFVIDRMPGSSGYQSDILLGDEIVAINGVPLEKSRRLILSGQEHRRGLFFIQANAEETIGIEYRRRQNQAVQSTSFTVQPAVPAEDVIGLSARVIESGKNRYGYTRFWNLMSMKTPGLARELMEEDFSNCHSLILDLRGRGGLIPAVLAVDKVVKDSKVPVIAITDDLTRSAKEMLSLLIKKHPHVTVIGQKTAGAVTGATMMRLPSGNGFMYPVMSTDALKRFTDNKVLERVGVEPDIQVEFQIPWCAGNDRLLEAAIETADEQIAEFLKTIL